MNSMRLYIFLIGFLFFYTLAYAQEMCVKSFSYSPTDAAASVHQVLDGNNEPCALIRVLINEPDFEFETPLGIVKQTERTGEILLYVPAGSKKITIRHPRYGVLRDYAFPPPDAMLKGKHVYELVLETNREPGVEDMPDWYALAQEAKVDGDAKRALQYTLSAAHQGSLKAMEDLMEAYYDGDGSPQSLGLAGFYGYDFEEFADLKKLTGEQLREIPKNMARFVYWQQQAIEKGSRRAASRENVDAWLISMIEPKTWQFKDMPGGLDLLQMFDYLEKRRQKGDAPASFAIGLLRYQLLDDDSWDAYFLEAAEAGHPAAQCFLGTEPGLDEALQLDWLKRAAEAGHPHACERLAFHYECEKNDTLAIQWYIRAARGANFFGHYYLGQIYFRLGDYPRAAQWYADAINYRDLPYFMAWRDEFRDGPDIVELLLSLGKKLESYPPAYDFVSYVKEHMEEKTGRRAKDGVNVLSQDLACYSPGYWYGEALRACRLRARIWCIDETERIRKIATTYLNQ